MRNIVLLSIVVLLVLATFADARWYPKKGCVGKYSWYHHGRCGCRKGYFGYPHCKPFKKSGKRCGHNAYWHASFHKCVCKSHCKGNPYKGCRYYK